MQSEEPINLSPAEKVVDDLTAPERPCKRRYWTPKEEEHFYDIWGRENFHLTRHGKNMVYFVRWSDELRARGFDVRPEEVQAKVNQARSKFRQVQKQLKTDSIGKNAVWKKYDLIDKILRNEYRPKDDSAETPVVAQSALSPNAELSELRQAAITPTSSSAASNSTEDNNTPYPAAQQQQQQQQPPLPLPPQQQLQPVQEQELIHGVVANEQQINVEPENDMTSINLSTAELFKHSAAVGGESSMHISYNTELFSDHPDEMNEVQQQQQQQQIKTEPDTIQVQIKEELIQEHGCESASQLETLHQQQQLVQEQPLPQLQQHHYEQQMQQQYQQQLQQATPPSGVAAATAAPTGAVIVSQQHQTEELLQQQHNQNALLHNQNQFVKNSNIDSTTTMSTHASNNSATAPVTMANKSKTSNGTRKSTPRAKPQSRKRRTAPLNAAPNANANIVTPLSAINTNYNNQPSNSLQLTPTPATTTTTTPRAISAPGGSLIASSATLSTAPKTLETIYIEEVRKKNAILGEHKEIAAKRLRIEERKVALMEYFFPKCLALQEQILQKLQK